MFVYSLRASTLKFVGIICLSVIVLIALIAFIPTYEPTSLLIKDEKISYDKITDNEERIAFISQFGWEVNPEPADEAEVTVPSTFDAVYTSYNTIQKAQGLNLEKYKNKKVMRYTYVINNYSGYEGKVFVNLLVYKNKVIGGDVCSAALDGFVHGFEKA